MTGRVNPPIRRDDLIYDLGLCRGEDTGFYLEKGFRVVAFEADPALVRANRVRFAEALAEGRLVIVEGAVVDDPSAGPVSFYRNLSNEKWGTVHRSWDARNRALGARSEVIEVPAVSLAASLREHGVPYYMKIDIEGADRTCLEQLGEVPVRPCFVSLESEKVDFGLLEHELDLLEGLGYDRFQAVQQDGMRSVRAPLPAREGRSIAHRFRQGASGLFGRELDGPWRSRDEIRADYESIFRDYARFGDASGWHRNRLTRAMLRSLSALYRRPLPGWYDTHARHSTVQQPVGATGA